MSWHFVQDFKNVPRVCSSTDRSVAPSPVAHCHISINIINPITLAGLLEPKQSIIEAEIPGSVVYGLVTRTEHRKQNVKCVVITYLLFILEAFSLPEKTKYNVFKDNAFWMLETVCIKECFVYVK